MRPKSQLPTINNPSRNSSNSPPVQKKDVDEQQRQVQTMLSSNHDGKVTTEDLDQEKHNKRRQHDRGDDKETEGAQRGNEKCCFSFP